MRPGGSPVNQSPDGSSPVRITILGTSLTVKADEDPVQLQDVVDFYCHRVREVSRSFAQLDPLKIAILTGVLLADDLRKSQNDKTSSPIRESIEKEQEAERITRRIIETLDQTLERS